MRRIAKGKLIVACLTLALVFAFCLVSTAFAAPAKFHIGIVTGTVSQSEDELRGAERVIEEYGDVNKGGMIRHLTYPDNFMSEMETTIAQIASMADDPLMKAVVVNQGIPGTAEGLRRIKEKRPDIICLVGQPQEDPAVISEVADYTVVVNNVIRGYLIPYMAKQLGAKTFVHISFPRHMSVELLSRRRAIMEEACKDLGIKYAFETAPDPTSDVGVAGAQQFILEKVPAWIEKYGKDTAFFCTNDAHNEPLLKQCAAYGGIMVEQSLPSTLMGYPGAFGIDLKGVAGDWNAIQKKIEDVIVKTPGNKRLGTWTYSYSWSTSCALVEYGKRIVEGKAKLGNAKDLWDSYAKYTKGAQWNGSTYVDANSKAKMENLMMVYQDTYVFGKGYMKSPTVKVPEKYRFIK